jgi:hypothetical protein
MVSDPPEALQELNLDVPTEELLSAESGFTYADLYDMLGNGNTVLWLTPHTAVAHEDGQLLDSWPESPSNDDLNGSYRFCFTADRKYIDTLARSPEYLLENCDVVVRFMVASVVHSVRLRKGISLDDSALISAPALAYLVEQCQSLKVFSTV